MRPRTKWMLVSLVVLIAGIQFARPERTNPLEESSKTIFADASVWQDGPQTIERACMDCHSSRTRWPWYSNVAPVSWLVASDVNEGRAHMNYSHWTEYQPSQKISLLADTCKLVRAHSMPLPIYIPLHSEAKLTEQEREEICKWAEGALARVEAGRK